MSTPAIHFFLENISYLLKRKTLLRHWIADIIKNEGYELEELTFILCSDDYLLNINQQYLNHDDYTDVITFDNSEKQKTIQGDIFISIERIKENARQYNIPAFNELSRVMVHGTLHLLGYKDKTKSDKTIMTEKEDYYLSLFRGLSSFS